MVSKGDAVEESLVKDLFFRAVFEPLERETEAL